MINLDILTLFSEDLRKHMPSADDQANAHNVMCASIIC